MQAKRHRRIRAGCEIKGYSRFLSINRLGGLGPQPKGGQSPISLWVSRFGEWIVLNRDLTPFRLLRFSVLRLLPFASQRSLQSATTGCPAMNVKSSYLNS